MDKVLIIDDNTFEIRIMYDILKSRYDVLIAKSGEEGVALAKKENPMLILLDIVMKGLDGFSTLELLKADDITMNIPVIFLTGIEDEAMEEKGLMMGAMDYIKKPYNPNIVLVRVRNQIKTYRYQKTLEIEMAIDGLTGVHNRSDFQKKRIIMWENAKLKKVPLSFFLLDIDFFKMVNDTYGHSVGDNVLCSIAMAMSKMFKESDRCYVSRYGGEEFSIFLYNKDKIEAFNMAEQLRIYIKNMGMPNVNSKVCDVVTVSIGGNTIIPKEEDNIDNFIALADNKLYSAKESGRDRVKWN